MSLVNLAAQLFLSKGARTDTANTFSGTVAASSFDGMAMGGFIVPGFVEISYPVTAHASKLIYNIFSVPRSMTVTGIRYTTDVAQALTATLVKSTASATPASATTPLHTAGAINANTTIHSQTAVTLTATTADLALAATNKISLVLSEAMTTGSFVVNIRLRYS